MKLALYKYAIIIIIIIMVLSKITKLYTQKVLRTLKRTNANASNTKWATS